MNQQNQELRAINPIFNGSYSFFVTETKIPPAVCVV